MERILYSSSDEEWNPRRNDQSQQFSETCGVSFQNTSSHSLQDARKKYNSELDDVESAAGRVKKYTRKRVKRQMGSVESLFTDDNKGLRHKNRAATAAKRSFRRQYMNALEAGVAPVELNISGKRSLLDQLEQLSIGNEQDSIYGTFISMEEDEQVAEKLPALPDFTEHDELIGVAPNIVVSKEEIPAVVIFDHLFTDDEFGVAITHYHSPYKFWFYLKDQSPEFEKMNERMNYFYNTCTDPAFNMLQFHIKKDRLAAFRSSDGWHRVIILQSQLIPSTEIQTENLELILFLLDLGEIRMGYQTDLRFLKKEFAKLPRQSYRGRLALVSPVNFHWSYPDDTVEFGKLTWGAKLKARLYAFEPDDQIFHLILYNEENRYDYGSIQNIFGFLGHCRVYTPHQEYAYWPFNSELYPTFDDLENHEYPTFKEMKRVIGVMNQNYENYITKERKEKKKSECYINLKAAEGMYYIAAIH